jgi:hypothetical protein
VAIDTSHERPSVQVVGNEVYIRASSLGKCPRALAALMMGYKPDGRSEMLDLAAQEGHLHEGDVARQIRETLYPGLTLDVAQDICNAEYQIGQWTVYVTGHREGVWYAGDTAAFLWENKAQSQNQFELWLKSLQPRPGKDALPIPTFSNHPSHAWQISHYMTCEPWGIPVLYTTKNRNTGEISVSLLEAAPYTPDDIKDRLESVLTVFDVGEEALYSKSYCDPKANTWFCPVSQQLSCGQRDMLDVEEVFDEELEEMLIQYVVAKEKASEGSKEKKRLSPLIKKKVQSGRVQTLLGYEAGVAERSYTDNEALKKFLAEHGKTMEDFKKKVPVLDVKPPKGM